MAIIPQLNNPITGKGFTAGHSHRHTGEGEEQFDLIELAKPLEVKHSTEKESGGDQKALTGGQKDFLSMSVKIAKDPTMAVESLKQLVNDELLGIAKNNGYTELYGELDDLMKGMFLKPGNLVADIVAQEKQNTIFSGNQFFDILRELVANQKLLPSSQNAQQNYQNSQDFSNNTQNTNFWSTQNTQDNQVLQQNLQNNFGTGDNIKIAVGNMLKALTGVLNKNEILNALSANMKFLSGYFAPNKGLSNELEELSRGWAASDAPENFENLKTQTLYILKSVSESLLNNEQTQVLIPLIVHNLSRYNTNNDMLTDYFTQLLTQIPDAGTKNKLVSAFESLIDSMFGDVKAVKYNDSTNHTTNYTTNSEINQPLNQYFSENKQIPRFLGESLADDNYTGKLMYTEEDLDAPVKNYLLGKTDGLSAIKDTIGVFVRGGEMSNVLSKEISELGSINELVDYLNDILKNLPDTEDRKIIYENFIEIIDKMAQKEELPATRDKAVQDNLPNNTGNTGSTENKPGESMKNLINFIEKNIDHNALKSINNYNASNLLQSLINAPGVFTPLAHYIIPLQVGDSKAFGELWVDKDEDNASAAVNGGKRKYHLFLTFEIENAGRFEVDLYSLGEEVNISLMHPAGFEEHVGSLVKKVNRIVAQSGYVTKSFKATPLNVPHNLTQIFPHINEKRSGFNVKA